MTRGPGMPPPEGERRGPGAGEDAVENGDQDVSPSGDRFNAEMDFSDSGLGIVGGPGLDAPGPGPLPDVAALISERDEYLTALQRLQADFENYRKRVQRQQEDRSERAVAELVSKLLPILDVLDLAQTHLDQTNGDSAQAAEAKALEQSRALLLDALSKEGLERIDQRDVAFDPVVHDAVSHAPADASDSDGEHTVGDVLRAGYRWRGQTLRPAMVQVRG